MIRREELQTLLENILGSRNVYFQPPSTVRMQYPAIVYRLGDIGTRTNFSRADANDEIYNIRKVYAVTVIDSNPDSLIPDRIQFDLKYCSFAQAFTADNLNHWIFTVFW